MQMYLAVPFLETKMSGNYFGFSHTASHYSPQQQGSYGQHGASTHQGGHVFTPSAASPHTSYVVASTARPSAAYETTYTAQPASQYYSTTPQRHDTHHQQAGSSATYRAAAAYTAYTETTPTYEKQTYYQQPQQSNQSATYYSASGGSGTAARGKSNYSSYYQTSNNQQQKAKQTATYQTPAASFANQQGATKVQPKQANVSSVTYTPQSHTTGGAYQSSSSYGGNTKKYNTPSPAAQQQQPPQQQQQQQQHYATDSGYSYDAVVFSAASNYYQQQQRPHVQGMGGIKKNLNGQGGMKAVSRPQKPPPKPSQLHYCEVCKISCAGPLTYKEHLDGQKHKKKETALKSGANAVTKSSQPSYRCELCDVTCTGMDAYNAHIRGIKHVKVFKLHTKLGKPIPSTDPVKIGPAGGPEKVENKAGPQSKKPVPKKVVTPKISFVAGSKYSTTNPPTVEDKDKVEETKQPETKKPEQPEEVTVEDSSNIVPVGEDYVEEIKNEEGKLLSFNCKLCECRFNDPHAKEMHMKGRRHRLQYKNKVDPSLKVEAKPTQRNRRQLEEKMRRKMAKEDMMRRRDEEMRWRSEMRKYDEDMFWRHVEEERYYEGMRHHEEMFHEWMRRGGPQSGLPPPPRGPHVEVPSKRQENEIDRHVLAKHNIIYPKENELQAVQNMVSIVERALKMVSDFLTDADKPINEETVEKPKEEKIVIKMDQTPKEQEEKSKEEKSKEEKSKEEKSKEESKESEQKDGEGKEQQHRIMKGVMRVGVLAKGLLLTHDLNMELIVLCGEKPTRTLLERVFDSLPKQLAEITEEKFEFSLCVEEAALILSQAGGELKTTMKVSLTSPVMRDPPADADASRDPPDVLDKEKCLAALAALRHAKWFQAKAAVLPSCVVVIRVLRELCDRISTWAPLKGWPVELICERIISSAGQPLSPGDAIRRIFEAMAGGLLLPGGPGIYDPCEREDSDVLDTMTPQQKEEITASAQHALRLIVFRQVHKVLNMEPLYSQQRQFRRFNNRKRRLDQTETGQDSSDGKKDKKEGETEGVEGATDGEAKPQT